ncbi:hypothetical protein F5880DRAFT_438411 [Lentinula raphanica]|nr:hypothetical protein F5880DRAFT_438411 [Lentinula raphanica]
MDLLLLPNELLRSIIEYIAYTPNLPYFNRPNSLYKSASPELIALSVANWQLRQVCVPLLFANIAIHFYQNIPRLKEDITFLSKFAKILVLGNSDMGDEIISQNLHQFKQLAHVELRDCRKRTVLLGKILAYPTVTSVLINELPAKSIFTRNLSKVILEELSTSKAFSSDVKEYFDKGMKLVSLELHQLDSLDDQFGPRIIPGLKEIRMYPGNDSVSFAFLPVLSSTNPTLQKVYLSDHHGRYFPRHTPPFISSFIGECQRQDLKDFFQIACVALRRDIGQPSHVWYVMDLNLRTVPASTSLIEILALVASSFPQLEVLTLNLNDHQAIYHVNDLATTLGLFLSLRTLFLDGVYNQLDLGSNNVLPPVRQVDAANRDDVLHARVETAILWLTSLIAKAAKNLDIINIREGGNVDGNEGKHWRLGGWLHVLNGNRDIGGTLQRHVARLYPSTTVSLDTRMLPPDFRVAMGVSQS